MKTKQVKKTMKPKKIKTVKKQKKVSRFRFNKLTTLLVFVGLVGIVGAYFVFSSRAATVPPKNTLADRFCGTWALRQVYGNTTDQALTQFSTKTPEFTNALNYSNMRGFSLRAYWNIVANDADFNRLFGAGRTLVNNYPGQSYAIRVIAGKGVPASFYVVENGKPIAYSYVDSGIKIPAPFSTNINEPGGNPRFEQEYRVLVKRMIQYSLANDVQMIHFPWYGREWAEINLHPNLQAAPGYSKERWVQGHKNLIDIVYQEMSKYPQLTAEFPLSGWNNTGDGPAATTEIRNYLNDPVAHPAWANWSGRLFVQGNGYGLYSGLPDKTGTPTTSSIYRGMQMFDQLDKYTNLWSTMYDQLDNDPLYATYLEIYTESFGYTAQNRLNLQKSITDHYNLNCKPKDTINPTVAVTSPANGSSITTNQVKITASANDNTGVNKVEFIVNGNMVFADTEAPYEYNWDTAQLESGQSYTISARAFDAAGNTGNSPEITVKKPALPPPANIPPTVYISWPNSSVVFNSPANIYLFAKPSDSDGKITKVEFYRNDGTKLGEDTTPDDQGRYQYNWLGVKWSTYNIYARAYDNSGAATDSARVEINVYQ